MNKNLVLSCCNPARFSPGFQPEGVNHVENARQEPHDLALALKRYGRMKPANAWTALYNEWPGNIAGIVDRVLWPEVKARSVEAMVREVISRMDRVRKASAAVHNARGAAKLIQTKNAH